NDELRRLAAQKLAQEKPGQTFQATALVHEAYLRLVDVERAQRWNSRGHFFAAAAEAMRRILVDHARRKQSKKRGGGRARLDLDQLAAATSERLDDVLDIDAALAGLAGADPQAPELVKLRYVAGLRRAAGIAPAGGALAAAPRRRGQLSGETRGRIAGHRGDFGCRRTSIVARSPRRPHRPVQAAGANRRRRHGHGLDGPADGTGQ